MSCCPHWIFTSKRKMFGLFGPWRYRLQCRICGRFWDFKTLEDMHQAGTRLDRGTYMGLNP
jgi:hypothetical protein